VHGLNQRFRIIHPFHPLRDREFEMLDARWSWGKRWLYCCDDEGQLFAVPSQWTDQAEQDPFVAVGAGRAHGRIEDLLRLAELVEALLR
jgi:hypothetical protein